MEQSPKKFYGVTWRTILTSRKMPKYTYELSEGDQYLRVRTYPSQNAGCSREAIYMFVKATDESRLARLRYEWCPIKGIRPASFDADSFDVYQLVTHFRKTPKDYYKVSGYFKSIGNTLERIYRRVTEDELYEIQ